MTTVSEEGKTVLVVFIPENPSVLFSPFSYNISLGASPSECRLMFQPFVFKKGQKVVICASYGWLLVLWGFCVIWGVCSCCFFNANQGVLQLFTLGRNLDTL